MRNAQTAVPAVAAEEGTSKDEHRKQRSVGEAEESSADLGIGTRNYSRKQMRVSVEYFDGEPYQP